MGVPCLSALPTMPGWVLFTLSVLTLGDEPCGCEQPLWTCSMSEPDLGGSISLLTMGKGPVALFL